MLNKNTTLPPKAMQKPVPLTIHNYTRIDNYFWLNERENPEVHAYLNAENAYKEEVMAGVSDLQEEIFKEIIGRIKQTDESVPYKKNEYYYYVRFEEGKEHAIYCRKKETLAADEEVLLNVNELAEGHSYYQIGGLSVSNDNRWLAYGVDTQSRRIYTIHFKNLETDETLENTIPNTTGSATWANENNTLFFTRKNEQTLRSESIFRIKLGEEASKAEHIYTEDDDTFYTGVYKTKSQKFLVIWSGSTLTNHYQILEADTPDGAFREFSPRERGVEYSIEHFEDKFYVITNWEAQNFRLMETPDTATPMVNWKEVMAHRKEVYLEGAEVFQDYLVLEERTKGLSQMRIMNQKTGEEHYMEFTEEAYMASVSTNPEFDSEVLRYSYQSMTTPSSTYDYNMRTREKALLKQQEVLGGFEASDYETKRLYAKTSDGVEVPISLVCKKGLELNGQNPTLLYGYGSYGITIDPTFSSSRLSLLDRGFVFAIAHIRGGQLNGRGWYEEGKLFKKENTFADFIACAEYLIAERYTSPNKLTAMGGSAGGLLMGAVVNLRPDLFQGIVAAVPFVDIVTTMLDDSIPLTTGEYDEWGNPSEEPYYKYMLSYSPYDNVEAKSYPHMLVTTGLHDSQVQYWEPAKWVAKLRELKTDNNLLLLHTNMETGHSGQTGRFEAQKETAMDYAFLIGCLEVERS